MDRGDALAPSAVATDLMSGHPPPNVGPETRESGMFMPEKEPPSSMLGHGRESSTVISDEDAPAPINEFAFAGTGLKIDGQASPLMRGQARESDTPLLEKELSYVLDERASAAAAIGLNERHPLPALDRARGESGTVIPHNEPVRFEVQRGAGQPSRVSGSTFLTQSVTEIVHPGDPDRAIADETGSVRSSAVHMSQNSAVSSTTDRLPPPVTFDLFGNVPVPPHRPKHF